MMAHPLSTPASCFLDPSLDACLSPRFGADMVSNYMRPQGTPAVSIANGVGLAHDAGNLLGALGLYTQLLKRPGVLQPQHSHYAEELQSLSERSGSLIAQLLRGRVVASGTSSGKPPDSSSDPCEERPHLACDGAATLRQLLPLLRSVAAPDADVVLHVARALPQLPCLAEALERIVVNLVRNAAEACSQSAEAHDAPTIYVRLKASRTLVHLEVEDNGPGMPPAVAARFLYPTPLPAGEHRGLGHRIVQELVAASGGKLAVTGRPGRGTTVRIAWDASCAATSRAASTEVTLAQSAVRPPLAYGMAKC